MQKFRNKIASTVAQYWLPFLAIVVIPLIYIKHFIDPVLIPKFLGICFISVFGIVLLLSRKRALLPDLTFLKHPLLIPYLMYIIISGISLSYSINFADGLFAWVKSLAFLVFLVLLVLFFQRTGDGYAIITKCLIGLALVTIAIALYQLVVVVKVSGITHHTTYLIKSTYAHRNLLAQSVFLTLPFTLYGIYRFKGLWRWLAVIASLLSLGSITFLLTRSVWVAFMVSALAGITCYLISEKPWKTDRPYGMSALFKFLATIVALVLVVGSMVYLYSKLDTVQTFEKQISESINFSYGTVNERIELWERSIEMFRTAPFTGTGTGSWNIEMLKFGSEGLQSDDGMTFFQRPHNDWLWVLSETGIGGFLSYLGIFLFALGYYFKLIKEEETRAKRIFFIFMISGLMGYMFIAMLSFPKERITHQLLLALMFFPILFEHKSKQGKVSGKLTIPVLAGMLIIVLLTLSLTSIRAYHELNLKKAMEARSIGNWEKVIQECQKASGYFYRLDPMSTPVKWYSGSAHFNSGQIDLALADFKESYRINPWHIHVLNNLATCYELKGKHAKAIKYYRKALAITPSFDDAIINLSAVYYNTGQFEKAYQELRKCSPDHPKFRQYLLAVMRKKTTALIQEVDEKLLVQMLSKIRSIDDWLMEIYRKSGNNNVSFEQQLIRDAIISLHTQEKSITLEKSNELKEKYKTL